MGEEVKAKNEKRRTRAYTRVRLGGELGLSFFRGSSESGRVVMRLPDCLRVNGSEQQRIFLFEGCVFVGDNGTEHCFRIKMGILVRKQCSVCCLLFCFGVLCGRSSVFGFRQGYPNRNVKTLNRMKMPMPARNIWKIT